MLRIALGYDLHRLKFKENTGIILGGIFLPCDYSIDGAHSDGDVLSHAITDAFFSLVKLDIGRVFPDTDPKNKDLDSFIFLQEAFDQTKGKYQIVNIDTIIICDYPKIALYADNIIDNLADFLSINRSDISLRGKTTEGTREGTIEVFVTALFEKKY